MCENSHPLRIYSLKECQVHQDNLDWETRHSHGNDLHRPTMMTRSRVKFLYPFTEKAFYAFKDDGGVIDGITQMNKRRPDS